MFRQSIDKKFENIRDIQGVEGMTCILHKYQENAMDYFVFDCQKNQFELSQQQIRKICQRNCALSSKGVVVGPKMDTFGNMHLALYNTAGELVHTTEDGLRIFSRYLEDAGYTDKKNSHLETPEGSVTLADFKKEETEISYIGRMYLSNEFLQYTV